MPPRHMPADCHLLHGGPCECCLQLQDIDHKLSDSGALIDPTGRREILRRVNQRHDPFIIRLPTELAFRVFQLCMPSDEENGGKECMLDEYSRSRLIWAKGRKVGMPHSLGMVCHQWREIAISTPRLWTSIPIFVFDDEKRMYDQLELVKQWAKWSGNLPLSVGFWDYNNNRATRQMKPAPDEVREALRSVLDFVNSLTSRCKSLNISLPIRALLHLTGNGEPLDHLQEIQIASNDSDDDRAIPKLIGHCQLLSRTGTKKPNPKRVVLTALPSNVVAISWSNVVDLSIALLPSKDIVAILREAPRLKKLAVRRVIRQSYSANSQQQLPHVVHDCLQSLTANNASTETASLSWQLLTFPALTHLNYQDQHNHSSFFALLARSKCHLETVSVSSTFTTQEIIRFFQLLPFLVNLKVSGMDTGRVLLALLQHARGFDDVTLPKDLPLLPLLQRFVLLVPRFPQRGLIDEWWIGLLAFLETLARDNRLNASMKSFQAIFRDTFAEMPVPPFEVLNDLPKVAARAAQKGVAVTLVDNKGANLLDHCAAAIALFRGIRKP